MEAQNLLRRDLPDSVNQINNNIEKFTANLNTIRTVQAAIVEKWGSGPRERMRERRVSLQGENTSIRETVRQIFDTGRESRDEIELLEATKEQWRIAVLEGISIDAEYKNKLEEQMVRLLRSLGIKITREQIETFFADDLDTIRSNHQTGLKEEYTKDWKQVADRLEELRSLEAYLSTLSDELIKLEEPIFHLVEEDETEDISTLQDVKKYALSIFNDPLVFSKNFIGRRWKLMSSLIAATILGLLIIVIYGIVNAASRSSSPANNNNNGPAVYIPPTNDTVDDTGLLETSTPCVPSSPSDICAYTSPTS